MSQMVKYVSESLKYISEFLNNTNDSGNINAQTAVPLKYISNFLRTLEMLLINFEINLILTWSENCIISEGDRERTIVITNTKLYVFVVALSTQDNTKLL